MDKALARLIKKKGEKTQFNRIRNENGEQLTLQKHKGSWELLQATICQQNRQSGRYGQILRKVQHSKTEPGRKWKYKQTNQKYWNWDCD